MPIYYVVSEYIPFSPSMPFSIKRMIVVYTCDLSDIDRLYRDKINELYQSSRNIILDIYIREPENPFKEFNNANI